MANRLCIIIVSLLVFIFPSPPPFSARARGIAHTAGTEKYGWPARLILRAAPAGLAPAQLFKLNAGAGARAGPRLLIACAYACVRQPACHLSQLTRGLCPRRKSCSGSVGTVRKAIYCLHTFRITASPYSASSRRTSAMAAVSRTRLRPASHSCSPEASSHTRTLIFLQFSAQLQLRARGAV